MQKLAFCTLIHSAQSAITNHVATATSCNAWPDGDTGCDSLSDKSLLTDFRVRCDGSLNDEWCGFNIEWSTSITINNVFMVGDPSKAEVSDLGIEVYSPAGFIKSCRTNIVNDGSYQCSVTDVTEMRIIRSVGSGDNTIWGLQELIVTPMWDLAYFASSIETHDPWDPA